MSTQNVHVDKRLSHLFEDFQLFSAADCLQSVSIPLTDVSRILVVGVWLDNPIAKTCYKLLAYMSMA